MVIKKEDQNQLDVLFLHSKPVKMLISLKKDSVRYATQVAKSVDCTYSHTVKVLDNFKNLGLVSFDKKGRIKIVKLTDLGTDIAHDFEGLQRKFDKVRVPSREAVSAKINKIIKTSK
ncbi:MAG: hypothetical protein KJ906_01180 [Nanoarchaeota archaeon]|nr:hypothetical protein [Nanoarchaeota archaeon]